MYRYSVWVFCQHKSYIKTGYVFDIIYYYKTVVILVFNCFKNLIILSDSRFMTGFNVDP